jgi:hypothetical protein
VTRYRIDKSSTAAAIQLTEVGGKRQQLLEAFQDCAEGHCSCPTTEYGKVASMQVEGDEDRIAIKLEAKPASDFSVSQIADCLAHTVASVEGKPNR